MISSKRNQRNPALGVVALGLLTMSSPAWAYLDPGTGSMIISAIVGLFATVGLAVKTYWYKLKGFFRRDQGINERRAESQAQPATEPGVEQGTEPERSTES
ncbi:MAG: hypothetical protein ACR2QV_13455 [Gammaproteobacteria bacterium]